MASEDSPCWFVVYTMPRHEKFAARNLELREIEYFLPTYEKVSLWRNRQKMRVVHPLVSALLVCAV